MYGRLKDGVSPAAARDMLRAAMTALRTQQPEHFENDEWLEPIMGSSNFMRASERLQIVGVMSLLGALTGLVLLVAASNIGNLVLSRATGRARELGVRIALGARRSRIVRQLVVETMPLGLGRRGRRPRVCDVGIARHRRSCRHAGVSRFQLQTGAPFS